MVVQRVKRKFKLICVMLYVVTVNRRYEKQEMMRAEGQRGEQMLYKKTSRWGVLRSVERKQLHTTWNMMNELERKHGNMIAERRRVYAWMMNEKRDRRRVKSE